MASKVLPSVGIGLILLTALGVRLAASRSGDKIFEVQTKPTSLAPMCPWREPAADLQEFFPTATGYGLETRILSGLRLELSQQLGRPPTAEENALQVFRILQGHEPVGEIVTRRLKGTSGAIEIVLAADTAGRILGLRLQRQREPEAVVQALRDEVWRRWFVGKDAKSPWHCDELMGRFPAEARDTAKEIVNTARSTMILLGVSERGVRRAAEQSHEL